MSKASTAIRPRIGLLAACLTLGACNSMGGTPNTSLEQSVPGARSDMQALGNPQASARQAPSAAIVSLPSDAGTVASVKGRSYANGFRQDILLKESALRGVENGVTVIARTSQQATLDEATPLFKPTEAAIHAEMNRSFPHIAMQVVERPMSNAYGSYGLALGRASGTIHCIYAWQWIEASDIKDAGLTGPVTVRVRLCKADTSFDALAELVDHLIIHRDAAGENVADTAVEPPNEQKVKAPRKRIAHRHVHRVARSIANSDVAAAPSAIAAIPVVTQPLATDLPPQAFLGPKAARQP